MAYSDNKTIDGLDELTSVDATDVLVVGDQSDSDRAKKITKANLLTDISAATKTLTNTTIDADGTGNSITNIENENIKAAAAIDATKIADASVSNTEFQYLNGVSSAIQTQLDAKVDENAAITGATKTKITYDAKGLVTAGADATTADIADSSNKRYVTDAQLVVIGNTSGTNTGDQTLPVKATGAELNTGTDDAKFATAKALADSNYEKNPMTTAGDIIVGGTAGAPARLALGSANQVLTVNSGGTAAEWKNSAAGFSDPMTTRGDIIIRNSSNVTARLGIGTSGQVLKSDGTDIAWSTVAGGGDVSKVGTPVDNQLGVWTGDGTIEGDSALTFDTSTDTLAIGASGKLNFGAVNILSDSAGTTTLANIDALDATTEATIEGAIDTLANLASIGSFTGVLRGDSGTLSVDTDVTDIVSAASDTAAGKVELATTAETNTGTDATRAVTPDGLADSKFGTSSLVVSLNFIIDGGGSAITTGVKGFIEIPFACTINQVTTLANQSGSIVVDIWKDTYANYPPTVADTITSSAKPTLSSATKAQDSTLTGWTTSVSAGDILGFNVDSATTVTRVTIALKLTRT